MNKSLRKIVKRIGWLRDYEKKLQKIYRRIKEPIIQDAYLEIRGSTREIMEEVKKIDRKLRLIDIKRHRGRK